MTKDPVAYETFEPEDIELAEGPDAPAALQRREFLQVLGAGVLISASAGIVSAAQRGPGGFGRGAGDSGNIAARLHIDKDGTITVMTGKVEEGQGARAQLTQAAAEELCVAADQVKLIMADTALTPDDGITAGSRTTPSNVPAVRKAAAAARELLIDLACKQWKVDRGAVEVRSGTLTERGGKRTMTYAQLAAAEDLGKALAKSVPADVAVTPVKQWKVLGTPVKRPNIRDLVTGAHRFPSDVVRPRMLNGKVLRRPSYGATLTSIDLGPAKAMEGVVVVRDGEFVGCCATSLFRAEQALEALAKSAVWKTVSHPSSEELFAYLKQHAQGGGGGGRGKSQPESGSVEKALADAKKTLKADYHVAYVQHAPMEPRAAVAEWEGEKLTVWTGSSNPFGVSGELASAMGVGRDRVRVIVPDMGGGFGGKHTGEAAVEAARLARAAGKPVCLRWSREEEFTWAYFRPAALIEIQGALAADGSIAAWDFTNINSGGAAVDSPYAIANKRSRFVQSSSPLRQSSYRALAATANNFARESFMDELAHAAGRDPLAFRLDHLKEPRLRAVLEAAATKFGWSQRKGKTAPGTGVGLACGTEKGSVVAACVEVAVDRKQGRIEVRSVCETFECGAIQNPAGLLSQVQGCILMGMGPALSEEIRFENGKILNPAFRSYQVPRFEDVPAIEVHLLDRPDLASVGAGETPIIAIAPAITNAVFDATGIRIRRMPITDPALKRT
jgi:isoquinoline 1-oxidoreductase subunit beta